MSDPGPLYHRSAALYQPGDRITGGNWGRIIFGVGPAHPAFYREYMLEKLRAAEFPDKPSRMRAVFAFTNHGFAARWKRVNAPEYVYSVRLDNPDCAIHRGDMGWIDALAQYHSFDSIERGARHYWSGDEREPESQTIEVLAAGDLIVVDRLTPIQENGLR